MKEATDQLVRVLLSLEVEKEEDGLGPVGARVVDADARLEIVDVVGVEVLDQVRLGALLHSTFGSANSSTISC